MIKSILKVVSIAIVAGLGGLLLVGCANFNLRERAPDAHFDIDVTAVDFSTLKGEQVILGGEISALREEQDEYGGVGTIIELSRYELNTRGYPMFSHPIENERIWVKFPERRMSKSFYELGGRLSAVGPIIDLQTIEVAGIKQTVIVLEAETFQHWPLSLAEKRWRDPYYDESFGFNSRWGMRYHLWL